MYAVFEVGKKQYLAEEGKVIDIDLLDKHKDSEIEFSDILMVRDENNVIIDNLSAFKIKARVLGEKKAKKITIMKHIPRKGHHKKIGHRQKYTSILIEKIEGPLAQLVRASDS
ncbi:MAG: 50S ribosomal protein L21 [bacterium]